MHRQDSVTAAKCISQLLERVTCFECCKNYLAPEAAACGHNLCHGCWYGRLFCAHCKEPVNRKALKLNTQIQDLTVHVSLLVEEFEKLFNIKFDELAYDNLDVVCPSSRDSKCKLTDNVKHWSQSSQELKSMRLSLNRIQMHEETKIATDSARLVQIPQEQDDTIEVLSDTEGLSTNHKDNVIRPMDVDGNEYTTENPHRSSGEKGTRNKNQCFELFGASKQSSINSADKIDIKNKNAKRNCNNVKNMREKFSKVNKINRNKLNVSIEMCQKTQHTMNTPHATSSPIVSDQISHVIDENSQKKSDTPKEARVQLLKNTESTQLEMLVPIIKSAKLRNTWKHENKRTREIDNKEETPNKKAIINIENMQKTQNRLDNRKNSENVFSLYKKDNIQNSILKENEQIIGLETQKNLLTPGMHPENGVHTDDEEMTTLHTPGEQSGDDYDIRVMEETPQKNLSFSNHKTKHDFINLSNHDNGNNKHDLLRSEKELQENIHLQDISDVVDLSQTVSNTYEKQMAVKNTKAIQNKNICVGGSSLTSSELADVKRLCLKRNWMWVNKYTKELSHLIVGVDDENKSQRTVKYMCALAAGKWIVSFAWAQQCLQTNEIVDEELYEVLDFTGEPGPRRSRMAIEKLFHGMTFYCMPPFEMLEVDTVKEMLEAAGGRVVDEVDGVRAEPDAAALLLAEPDNTQENLFACLAVERGVVPVHYEWMLDCLGTYALRSVRSLLLCPAALLPVATAGWPAALMALQ